MQEFLKYHIDVFNLIEQDLAISIHDVGQVSPNVKAYPSGGDFNH